MGSNAGADADADAAGNGNGSAGKGKCGCIASSWSNVLVRLEMGMGFALSRRGGDGCRVMDRFRSPPIGFAESLAELMAGGRDGGGAGMRVYRNSAPPVCTQESVTV